MGGKRCECTGKSSYTGCSDRSPTRFRLADDSCENSDQSLTVQSLDPKNTNLHTLESADRRLLNAPSFTPLTPTSSLFGEQTLNLATVSRLWVREFGTVYPPHCGSLTLNLDTLNDLYRHFCLVRRRHISDILISMHRV